MSPAWFMKASRNSSIPEVGGDLATYIDLDDNRTALATIAQLIADDDYLDEIGARIARDFRPLTWGEATEALLVRLKALQNSVDRPELQTASLAHEQMTFSPDCIPVFDLGERIEFGFEYNLRPGSLDVVGAMKLYAFFGKQWHSLEHWGRWSAGRTARLVFGITVDAGRDFSIYLGLRLPDYYGPTRVAVSAGGKIFGEILLKGSGQDEAVRFRLSSESLVDVGGCYYAALDLTIERESIPLPKGNDERVLGVGVSHILICRADDVESRMAYIEEFAGIKLLSEPKSHILSYKGH